MLARPSRPLSNLLAGILMLTSAVEIARAEADPSEPIRYTVRFPAPQTHYLEVEASIPTGGGAEVEVMMAVWTPGSYLVREFARQVEGMSARSPEGQPLRVEKSRKNRWKVQTGGAGRVTLAYRVYCRELSVRTNYVDSQFALLNGAPTFVTLVGGAKRAHEIEVVPPPGWLTSITGLPDQPGGKPHRFVAGDFDTVVDSPILVGNPAVYEFEVDGKKHYLVNEGEGGVWDGPKSARDVEAIVRTQKAFWGQLPYEKYVFFNLLVEAGGGLEHKNSTVLMASRWGTRTRKAYLSWLSLVSHEFFHTWNVKRLRPVELGPFDYENEVPTRTLWVAEGITEYYGKLLVHRAGLSSLEEVLAGDPPSAPDKPSSDIEVLQDTPGRLVLPLESASYDAWIKFYRPDENSANTGVSYYTKGAVVAFLLDAKVRKATDGKKSLDDVMRLAYDRFSGERGFSSAEFRAVAQEVAGADFSDWFVRALETTDELDYDEALEWFGLRFRNRDGGKGPEKAAGSDAEGKAEKPPRAWLGLVTRNEDGRLVVAQVRRGTPGFDAGFNVGDEILAIGEFRVRPDQWSARMDQYRPNESASILVARRDRLQRLDAVFGEEPRKTWALEVSPDAGPEAKARREAWLAP